MWGRVRGAFLSLVPGLAGFPLQPGNRVAPAYTMSFFRYFNKHRELIPLAMIMTTTLSGMVYTGIRALRRSDIIIDRWNNPEPWEKVDPTEPQKLFSIHQKWEPIQELEEIRKVFKG
ncbi:normal mucosa of esophagus-specific gene 1 protein isoform X1 [Pantherophis guttatus]|uniref:Normal mucosa of esophagus-specific gene 1 protein isoform X1 n=2 Tax=Pantherophis guttatus TaxID=94885 RepID=A0A6P9DGX5_PANGU|nr:normal mucosa of esophagus-specific gene 1 protein isoform X1 [Pantherophis guttatus]